MSKYQTAQQIIDRTSVEVGLGQQTTPYSSTDEAIIQMIYMLNTAGQELVSLNEWQQLQRIHSFTTAVPPDTGIYDLPDDFHRMIPQTNWDRTNRLTMYGSLTPQDWEYLLGRQLAGFTIYASFRQVEGQLWLFPQPPPNGIEVAFEYISKNWIQSSETPSVRLDTVALPGDVLLFEPHLLISFLKVKFYTSKGFDTTKAEGEFTRNYNAAVSADRSAPILNAASNYRRSPLLNGMDNVPDTGYGS